MQTQGIRLNGGLGVITRMRRSLLMCAMVIVGLLVPIALAAPASASTQVVRFSVGSTYCSNGVYGISHVEIFGTGSAPWAGGSWTGNSTTASVAITGVPSGGGQVYVVATYHCKILGLPGPGHPASGYRWVYGSGWQPSYTL